MSVAVDLRAARAIAAGAVRSAVTNDEREEAEQWARIVLLLSQALADA